MATQIVIANKEKIIIDENYIIEWADKGNSMPTVPDTVHFIIWNDLIGQNEVQSKDASTGNMTGNTNLNATSDTAYGSTTVANLLTWAETRKGQIEAAKTAHTNAANAGTATANETWKDYDPNYS
jgi:hypothetical protein|tara:strand:+ start:67 stop:441 length:375 start_codon:yes stop_codon:yes gene_type:complete